MHTYAIRPAVLSTVGLALALVLGSALAATYRLTDLGTLGGPRSEGYAINASGQVAGISKTGDGSDHAFLWDGTRMRNLGTLSGTRYSVGRAINASGQVAGASAIDDSDAPAFHAFLWDGTTLQDLGTICARDCLAGGSISGATAINDSGQVTGISRTASGEQHAFLWDGTRMRDLGTLGGGYSVGYAINASGQVTGSSYSSRDDQRAFLWDGTKMQNLGTLGGFSWGNAINDSGQVTGASDTTYPPDNGTTHAVLWDGTRMRDLGTLGGTWGEGVAINASGQVAGTSKVVDGHEHAFLWNGTRMRDLGTLGGLYSVGRAINASGQVTGDSGTAGGEQHVFLWDGTRMQDVHALIDPADPLRRFVTLYLGVDINDRGQILADGFDSRTGEAHAYIVSPVESPPGVAFTLRPRSLAFGEQPIGSRTTLNLWLRNKGTAPLTIQRVSLRGTDRSQFALRHRCGTALAAGAVCGITVTFQPTSAGLKTARVRLIAGGITRIREVSGNGH